MFNSDIYYFNKRKGDVLYMNSKTKKLVMAALMAAVACVVTMIVKIPSPMKGYLNLGDCIVLTAGWMLSPLYGFLAAGTGSALADVFSGYIVYAPATFVIKGLMALTAYGIYRILQGKTGRVPARIVSAFAAEVLMTAGYFVFEGVLYGFVPSMVNIPANAVQGAAGMIIGVLLAGLLEKSHVTAE